MTADASAPITPVPLPLSGDCVDRAVRTLIVFGGTFDPPHKAHVHLPLLAARHLERVLDEPKGVWVLYVPAARSPHKSHGPAATDAQRLAMLELAVGHLPRTAVWSDEIDRAAASPGPSYTIDTLRRLRRWLDEHGGEDVSLRLLIGQDQAAKLQTWREPDAIIALAPPLVMARPGSDSSGDSGSGGLAVLPIGTLDASSTAVRAALAAGDEPALRRLLDAPVAAYITREGLYR